MKAPEGIDLRRHGASAAAWGRRFTFALLGCFVVAALLGAFGQRPVSATVGTDEVVFSVTAPDRLRSGLFYEGRFVVQARRALREPTLVLDHGWLEQMSLNTVAPEPVSSSSVGDALILTFERLRAGETLTIYLQLQVNSTNVGRRGHDVALRDGAVELARIPGTLTVFP